MIFDATTTILAVAQNVGAIRTDASWLQLIGSLGSSAAAVIVLVLCGRYLAARDSQSVEYQHSRDTQHATQISEIMQMMKSMHEEAATLAKDKGVIIRDNTQALERISQTMREVITAVQEAKCRAEEFWKHE